MLNNPVVVIDEIERAIGGSVDVDRAEAFVGGGKELAIGKDVFAGEVESVSGDASGFDKVGYAFGGEGDVVPRFWELVSAIVVETSGGGGVDELVSLGVEHVTVVAIGDRHVGAVDAWVDADGVDCVGPDFDRSLTLELGL